MGPQRPCGADGEGQGQGSRFSFYKDIVIDGCCLGGRVGGICIVNVDRSLIPRVGADME